MGLANSLDRLAGKLTPQHPGQAAAGQVVALGLGPSTRALFGPGELPEAAVKRFHSPARAPWRLPLIGAVTAVMPVAWREHEPQTPSRGGTSTAQHPSHAAARGPFDDQPPPDFALAAGDEGPHLIQFQGFRFAALGLFRPATRPLGQGQHRFFYQLGDDHPRHAGGAHGAALGVALDEQNLDLGIPRRLGHGRRCKPRLVPRYTVEVAA